MLDPPEKKQKCLTKFLPTRVKMPFTHGQKVIVYTALREDWQVNRDVVSSYA
jgi:hypothetical protein